MQKLECKIFGTIRRAGFFVWEGRAKDY
jgi:hypothetical protein